MGEIIARNMLSWLKLLIKLLLLHLVGCLHYCISDERSHKHQLYGSFSVADILRLYSYIYTNSTNYVRVSVNDILPMCQHSTGWLTRLCLYVTQGSIQSGCAMTARQWRTASS